MLETLEAQKDRIETESNDLMHEYKITLAVIEPWQSTGLENELDALENASLRTEQDIETLQDKLNNLRLV